MKENVLRKLFQFSNLLILGLCLAHIGMTTFLFRGKHAQSYASVLLSTEQEIDARDTSGQKVYLKPRNFTILNAKSNSSLTDPSTVDLRSRSAAEIYERNRDTFLDNKSFNAGIICVILTSFLLFSCFGGCFGELHRNKELLRINVGLLSVCLILSLSLGVYILCRPLDKELIPSKEKFLVELQSKYIPPSLRESPIAYSEALFSKIWDNFKFQTKCSLRSSGGGRLLSYDEPSNGEVVLDGPDDSRGPECFTLLNDWLKAETLSLGCFSVVSSFVIMFTLTVCIFYQRRLKPTSN